MFKLFSFIHNKRKLGKHGRICENNDFCYQKMLNADNNILESKPRKKSLKHPLMIYADLECLLLKMNICKSYTTAKALHKPSGYSLLT